MLTEKLLDRHTFAQWFGQYNSTPKDLDIDWTPEAPVAAADLGTMLSAGSSLIRNPASRFAFIRDSGQSVMLFVDGHSYACVGETALFAERLCALDYITIASSDLRSHLTTTLIASLINLGSVMIAEEG